MTKGLKTIAGYADAALGLIGKKGGRDWLLKLCQVLGPLAGQGVYVLNEQGAPVDFAVPGTLDADKRKQTKIWSDRPYFRRAHFFRQPFVSDLAPSVFNGNGTFLPHAF